jgi:hypothetical protein
MTYDDYIGFEDLCDYLNSDEVVETPFDRETASYYALRTLIARQKEIEALKADRDAWCKMATLLAERVK